MAKGVNAILEGGVELNYLSQKNVYMGTLFARIITAVNTLAKNVGVSAIGKLPAPPPINGITISGPAPTNGKITVPSEILHWTLTHSAPIQKGIQYITEIDTNPNFPQPHIHDHGCSRSGFLNLPTQDANSNPLTYYLRSYAQYHGSDPCKPTVLGGLAAPIGIQMTGSSKTSLLASTGSGTAQATGQQGGKGLGTVLVRPASQPKRSVQ